jgi:hypothetical protein
MLKTVSSITNAIGALNYVGTWNASTNTPALTSSVGNKGDYYQVSVAGSTTLNGISNWGVGDVAAFNGTTWQRIEGGADLNGVNLVVTGNSDMGNIRVSGNTIQAQNTDGSVSVLPNGTGFTKVKLESYRNSAGEIILSSASPQRTLAQLTLGAGTWLLTSSVSGVVADGLGQAASDLVYAINSAASIPAWNSTVGAFNRSYYVQPVNSFVAAGGTVALQVTLASPTTYYLYGGPSSITSTLQIANIGYLNAVKISE